VVNAQQLALARHRAGDTVGGDRVILEVAARATPPPPPWFIRKAPYILVRDGRHGEAVSMLLRAR
jgi:hypothetical protein